MANAIKVLLVDDHAVVREGYRRLLERGTGIVVVGEAADGATAYHEFCRTDPDVVVMDISLPGVSGIEATRRMLARDPEARVLIFSIHEEIVFARRALDAGAAGYLTKASAPDTLIEAVETVARGRPFLGRDIAEAMALGQSSTAEAASPLLSAREFEVLRLIVQGCPAREVAEKLGLSPKTVANLQSMIKQKLGAQTPAQLVTMGSRLLSP